jgi:hypothetical protein
MNKTWRERALDAQKSGHWARGDVGRWMDMTTCPAAEIVTQYGGWKAIWYAARFGPWNGPWKEIWELGDTMGQASQRRLIPPEEFLEVLELMEDRALQIKREGDWV